MTHQKQLRIKHDNQWLGSPDGKSWLPILNPEIIKQVHFSNEFDWPYSFEIENEYTTGIGEGSVRKPKGYILSLPKSKFKCEACGCPIGDHDYATVGVCRDCWENMLEHSSAHSYTKGAEPVNEDGWISVKDRLPEQGYWCLIYSWRGTMVASFWKNSWCFFQYNKAGITIELSDVSHWMPLPKPPKE